MVNRVDIQQLTNQFMELQVRGSGGTDRLRNIVDQEIAAELENIDGIATANVFGGKERSIELTTTKQPGSHNITPAQIRNALSIQLTNRAFAGYLHENQKQYFVHVTAEYEQVTDIENIIVAEGPIC
jgi:multidrug efflux pump subunit AcrB